MKILITGVAGLFGVHFSKYLLDKGYDVIGIDDLSGGYFDFVDERLKDNRNFYQLNINDDLTNVFEWHKPEVIFHFAAYAAEGASPFMRKFNYYNNVIGTMNIINYAIKYNTRKIIFTSSMAIYGNNHTPYYEFQIPSPVDPYGIAKYTIELDLRAANDLFGLEYTIIRPHNVVGIYQNIWDKYRNVIGIWMRQILNNEPVTIFGDGEQVRAFSDIEYYIEPLEKVINDHNKQTFNIGADNHYKIKDVANIIYDIAKCLGYNPVIINLETRDEVKISYCNHDKAKSLLNFEDKTDIKELIHKMFLWAKKEPKREVKKYDYEINKNIYSYWK
jgi:UDP-glucose 4-epimerase